MSRAPSTMTHGAPSPRRAALALAAALLTVAGCNSDTQELQAWMDQQRQEVRPSVEPLAAPTKFTPVPYANQQAADPFSNQKLSVAP